MIECIVHKGNNGQRIANQPSRPQLIGISEYAPGNPIHCDNHRYLVKGVVLNWHIDPAMADENVFQAYNEAQEFISHVTCNNCGYENVMYRYVQEGQQCPQCSTDEDPHILSTRRVFVPKTFTISFGDPEENTVEGKQDTKNIVKRTVGMEGTPFLEDHDVKPIGGDLLRYRYSTAEKGYVFAENLGKEGNQFYVCFTCGRVKRRESRNEAAPQTHPKLKQMAWSEAKKNSDCGGKYRQYSLGAKMQTDVFQIYIPDNDVDEVYKAVIREQNSFAIEKDITKALSKASEQAALTIAAAMRAHIADDCRVPPTEIGYAVSPLGNNKYAIALYDNESGGAGYVKKLNNDGKVLDVLKRARETLKNCSCEKCCSRCLIDFYTKYDEENLNRQLALCVLTEDFINRLENAVNQSAEKSM